MNTFLQITTIGYALISSIFLVSSSMVNTPKCIVSGMIDLNRDSRLVYNDCVQRALSIVGTVFILLSFIFGIWQSFRSLTWNDLDFSICGFINSIVLLIFSALVGWYILKYLKKRFYNKTKNLFSE